MAVPSLSDLPSTGYGTQAALERSAAALPANGAPASAPEVAPFIGADEVPNLSDPSARPAEPVTAGLPYGPGAGPDALGAISPDPVRRHLQAMLVIQPNNDIERLIDLLDILGR